MSLVQRCARMVRWTALALALSASPAFAQAEGTRNPVPHDQIISANPFLLIFEWFNVEYERKVGPSSTAGVAASFASVDNDDFANLGVFWRYYPQEAALVGFFVGPRAAFYRVSDNDDTGSALGLGFELGYTWLMGSDRNFAISIGLGATRLFGGDLGEDVSVTLPTVRLVNLGWAF